MASFQIQSSEVLARLKPFGITFEKSLSDLIKGIRAQSKESPESLLTFLDNAILECKEELATTDLEAKATAILKLAYLEMYGFDMSWCNFQILEVMSSAKFQQKRIGYLAAMQSFKNEQDLLVLATNQFKKDLNSHNHVEIGLALSGIATIVTPNLAKDIVDDVVMKLTHSKPYIRKKAILALFKVFLQYPESLRSCLPRVIEKLDDPDIAVVSATITVVCEISKESPNIFIGYLPKFFDILEGTANNWLIIRILKLFQSLLKIEPRMKKRILPSIVNLMAKTEATSLIYECVNCIVNGGMISADSAKDREIAQRCVEHLMNFFRTGDSNLKFVGLLALIKIVKVYPAFMHRIDGVSTVIMGCLHERDLIIKRKALEICQYLVTEDNFAELVKTLLLQLVSDEDEPEVPESIKMEVTAKILEIASKDNYSNIPNFKWYVMALKNIVDMTLLPSSDGTGVSLSPHALTLVSTQIGHEFRSVALRVPSIRPFLLSKIIPEFVNDVRPLKFCPALMKDFYWIMGEYSDALNEESDDEDEEDDDNGNSNSALGNKIVLFNTLVNSYVDKTLNIGTQFPVSACLIDLQEPDVLISSIEASIKVFSGIASDYQRLYSNYGKLTHDKYCQVGYFLKKLIKLLENWENHSNYEVQERCLAWLEYLKLCSEVLKEKDVDGMRKVEDEEMLYYRNIALQKKEATAAIEDDEESDDEEASSSENDSLGSELLQDESEASESEDEEVNGSTQNIEAAALTDLSRNEEDAEEFQETEKIEPETDQELPVLITEILPSFFKSYQLNPVSATAQKRIPMPEDLDLESTINSPPAFCLMPSPAQSDDEEIFSENEHISDLEPVDIESAARERLERLKDDPYYIIPAKKKKSSKTRAKIFGQEEESKSLSEASSEKNVLANLGEKLPSKPKKSKKVKKEKVVILSEETFGDEDLLDASSNQEEKESKKKKKNRLIIDSLNFDNLDISSPADLDSLGNEFEYNVDIEALREQLAEQAVKKSAKEKKKKEKKEASVKNLTKDLEQPSTVTTDSPVPEAAVPPKQTKKKKKKKAIILE